MSASFSLTLDSAAARAGLKKLAARGRSLRPMLEKLAFALGERTRLGFQDQVDPWGTRWTPLAPATLRKRRDAGRSGVSILRDTGQLLAAMHAGASADAVEIALGFASRPATIHQFGGRAGRGLRTTIPARPMLPIRSSGADLPPAWRDELVAAMSGHLGVAR